MVLPDKQREYLLQMSKKKVIRYFGGFVGKRKKEFLARHRCALAIEQPEIHQIDQKICPICQEKMRAFKPVFADDLPRMNLIRHNSYTFIDRELDAFIRGEGKRCNKDDLLLGESLLHYLKRVEESERS